MLPVVIVFVLGVFTGGALSFLFAAKVIAEVKAVGSKVDSFLADLKKKL